MWMHGFISFFLPSSWRGVNYIKQAKKLLIPEIIRRREVKDKTPEENNNLLSWMMEIATPDESNPSDLAHLEVVMSLASIHTSQMNAVHVMYDLASRPEYIEPLREEIVQLIKEDGPWKQWQKPSFSKLRKLDSFMRESQRVNPPSLLSYHRVMLSEHVCADGTVIPRDAHICMPVNAIQNAPETTPDADVFDGFRYYKLRQRDGESHLHQFVTTQPNILNFGHGKYACPGRFFAALEIKNILVRLIMDYDWKLPGGQGRPKNLTAHEFIFPNPDAFLLMRKRPVEQRLDSLGRTLGVMKEVEV
jgi:ent-kaurene oxidase